MLHPRSGVSSPEVMGIVNVTEDSFSDGGRYLSAHDAVAHGIDLWAAGATIIDVGGESTRPGAHRVDPTVEAARVVPVVRGLVSEGVTVSVDTMRAGVAEAAVDAGASFINDVSGGQADSLMAKVAADTGVKWILMHWRDRGDFVHRKVAADHYANVIGEVISELTSCIDKACECGVRSDQLIIDPGLGFAKNAQQNWQILANLKHFVDTGMPVLVGASRKRFLSEAGPPTERDTATATVSALAAQAGVWGIRVHDAKSTVDALRVVQHWGDACGG